MGDDDQRDIPVIDAFDLANDELRDAWLAAIRNACRDREESAAKIRMLRLEVEAMTVIADAREAKFARLVAERDALKAKLAEAEEDNKCRWGSG